MAFSNNLLHEVPMGQMRFMMGTFTNTGGSSGGDIRTGLHKVLQLKLQHTGSAVVADDPAVYETFPVNDPVTVVTTADADGLWFAWGW
jgi:hypothetical protein